MAHKHLHELLREDQEPFLLKNYIAEKRCKLTRLETKTHLQLNKPKLISNNFCKNACFFSFHDSPDPSKSPLFRPSSPAKSPGKATNTIFLQIPARTAAMLLEAAMKIQKQSETKNNGFGLFGSILKRLTRTRKREIEGDGIRVSVKDILKWDSSIGRKNHEPEPEIKPGEAKSSSQKRFSWASKSRMSSVWSDSNEERSLDLETASVSSCSEEAEEFVAKDCDDDDDDKRFCISPFRFALQKSCSGRRTPDFSSPATSPSRRTNEEGNEPKGTEEFRVQEEEEKEQCSPVSVLDPPFEDDDQHGDDDNEAEDDNGYNLECSYAIVQRAKHNLLNKLRRFERLAELDPIELEKRMLEEEEDDDFIDDDHEGGFEEDEDEYEDYDESPSMTLRVPPALKRLVSDLVAEERVQLGFNADEMVAKIVSKRLESWKEVESNTIDMMVGSDLRREYVNGWTRNDEEQIHEMGREIEVAILGVLVNELWDEGL